MRDLAKYTRPALPDRGEISKTLALRYLAPEILGLRALGFKLEAIREILEAEHLQVSLPLLVKALRPSSPMAEGMNG